MSGGLRMNEGINLASARLGAEAVACSDEFFAAMSRLIDDAEPVFCLNRFDDHGHWMDGWETRRRRKRRVRLVCGATRRARTPSAIRAGYPPFHREPPARRGARRGGGRGVSGARFRSLEAADRVLGHRGRYTTDSRVRRPEQCLPLGASSHLSRRRLGATTRHRPAGGRLRSRASGWSSRRC